MCEEVRTAVAGICDQIRDVFEYFGAEPIIRDQVIPNPYGGNPEYKVFFSFKVKEINGKEKVFTYRPASETVPAFVNRIRAHMFECVDSIISLGI